MAKPSRAGGAGDKHQGAPAAQIRQVAQELDNIQRNETLIRRIQSRMFDLGLNPFSAAKKAGLKADYIRDILRGKIRQPSAERLGKLAIALECTLYYLMGEEEPEPKIISRSPGREDEELPPPPAAFPRWTPADGKPHPVLLPIRYELMAETYRKATDVSRTLGFEATTIPPAYINRNCWWEVVRDDSVSAVARPGSLVLVAQYDDSERDQILEGEFVIMTERFVGPTGEFHLVQRSMRCIRYRYPHLGLWFAEYAHASNSELDLTDEVWRQTEPTAPRKSLDEIADEIEDPDDRAEAKRQNQVLREAMQKAREKANDPSPAVKAALERMEDPEFVASMERHLERKKEWGNRLVGKVIRVLTPVAPGAGFTSQ